MVPKTYPEMNGRISEYLRGSDDQRCLYAAQLIDELFDVILGNSHELDLLANEPGFLNGGTLNELPEAELARVKEALRRTIVRMRAVIPSTGSKTNDDARLHGAWIRQLDAERQRPVDRAVNGVHGHLGLTPALTPAQDAESPSLFD